MGISRSFFRHLCLLCCIWILLPSAYGVAAKQLVLAVGIIDFADTRIPKLNYCVRDAEVLTDYFRKSSGGKMQITLLKNEEATRQGIIAGLNRIKEAVTPEDTVIFYYSSHGLGDTQGNTYFVTFDTNKDDLASTALPMQEIKSIASGLGAKNIVMFFDTCHSGGAKSLGQQNEKSYDKLMLAASKKTRLAILTSSRTHENSVESPEWGHGVFTYYLLQGLQGKADNYPADGKISVTELFDYAMIAVPRATDRAQHPTSKFSYNWPGKKSTPVHIGDRISKTDKNVDEKPSAEPEAQPEKGANGEAENSWQHVLE